MRMDIKISQEDVLKKLHVLTDTEKEVLIAAIDLSEENGVLIQDIAEKTRYTIYEVEKAIMSGMRKIKEQ